MAQGILRPVPLEHRAQLRAMSSTKKQSKVGPLDFRESEREREREGVSNTLPFAFQGDPAMVLHSHKAP